MTDFLLIAWVSALIEIRRFGWMFGLGRRWTPGEKLRLFFAGYNGTRNTGSDVRVLPDLRRHGVGRQLQEAQQAWAKDHGYEYIRCECMNHQREFVHFAVELGYDMVGIRWDSTHADNLIVFEKNLVE